ncbi:MAG: hypothetical protein RL701_5427 [Pseudomonadota bacterium]
MRLAIALWAQRAVCVLIATGCNHDPSDASMVEATDAAAERADAWLTHTLAVSPSHTCALRDAGIYCWGENFMGQLGTGDTTESALVVKASVLESAVAVAEVAAATGRTCIRTREGTVACWGANERGQVGDGTTQAALLPVPVPGLDDATQLALDDGSTCVLHGRDQTVSCWGGASEDAWLPRTIQGLAGIVELRAGTQGKYCARDANHAVWCWRSDDGQWPAAEHVVALAGAKSVAVAGFDEVCALTENSEIVCHSVESGRSVALDDARDVVALNATGALSVCASKRDRSWYCWNILRPMLESTGSPPIAVRSEVPMSELILSGFRACALRDDQLVVCANANDIVIAGGAIAADALHVVEGLPR